MLGADDVQGFDTQYTEAIRDIAGNLLRTNQDDPPFETLLVVDLPAPLDFGDAPDPTYATLLSNNGVRHVVVPNIRLGSTNGAELDGQVGVGDDSDNGVTLLDVLTPGGSTPVRIVASTEGFIDAWIDVDGDGTFDMGRDSVLSSVRVSRGTNTLQLSIPEDATFRRNVGSVPVQHQRGLEPNGPSQRRRS